MDPDSVPVTIETWVTPPSVVEVTDTPIEVIGVETTTPVVDVLDTEVQVIEVAVLPSLPPDLPPVSDTDLLAHINSLNPHPVYDDLPSLSLIFENGII